MIVAASVIAAAIIIAQGLVMWGLLRFVKSFGAYTESQKELAAALLSVHESNRMIHEANVRMFESLRMLKLVKERA